MKSQCRSGQGGGGVARKGGAAFTLTELLVAVAVISALIALAFPAVHRAIDSGRTAACLGNMRAYGGAVLMYVAENGGTLPNRASDVPNPPPLRFGQWVEPYLPRPLKEFRCPLATARERDLTSGFTYTGNGALTEYFPTLKGIPAPLSRVVLASEMYDWTMGFWVSGHMNRTVWGNGNGGANPEDEGKARRPQYHGSAARRGLHLFFLDGHVELVSAPRNDWNLPPTLGNATNGGYFYTTGQFSSLKRGTMIVR